MFKNCYAKLCRYGDLDFKNNYRTRYESQKIQGLGATAGGYLVWRRTLIMPCTIPGAPCGCADCQIYHVRSSGSMEPAMVAELVDDRVAHEAGVFVEELVTETTHCARTSRCRWLVPAHATLTWRATRFEMRLYSLAHRRGPVSS